MGGTVKPRPHQVRRCMTIALADKHTRRYKHCHPQTDYRTHTCVPPIRDNEGRTPLAERVGGVLLLPRPRSGLSPTLAKQKVTVRKNQPRNDYANPSVESTGVLLCGCAVWRVSGWGAALMRGCGAVVLWGCAAVLHCGAWGQRGCKPAEAAAVRACEHQSGRVAARCPRKRGRAKGVCCLAAKGSA